MHTTVPRGGFDGPFDADHLFVGKAQKAQALFGTGSGGSSVSQKRGTCDKNARHTKSEEACVRVAVVVAVR